MISFIMKDTIACFLLGWQIRIRPWRRSWYIRDREIPISWAKSAGLRGAPDPFNPYNCRRTYASLLADRGSIFKILWARSRYSCKSRIICGLVMGMRISLEDLCMIFWRAEESGKGGWNSTGPNPPARLVEGYSIRGHHKTYIKVLQVLF